MLLQLHIVLYWYDTKCEVDCVRVVNEGIPIIVPLNNVFANILTRR
jgi:hypothetical protein